MLEIPTPTAADAAQEIKRYAPPNQRNRSLGLLKYEDRFDSEKNQGGSTWRNNNPVRDDGSTAIPHPRPVLIPLEGCSTSDASRLLSNRWAAVLNHYHDTSIDLSGRPVLHSGSCDVAWRNLKLPHQMISPKNSSDSQMDFLVELGGAIRNANADN